MQKIIIISGGAGTGKSFLAKRLAKKLNCKYLSAGKIAREMAKKLGMDIYQFQKFCDENSKIDLELDKNFVEAIKNEKDCVVADYRLGAKFFPEAFKIFLKTDIDEVVKRVRIRDNDLKNLCDDKIKQKIEFRNNEARERFIKLYNFDFTDENHYDLIIDNTNLTPNETLDIVLKSLQTQKPYSYG